MTIQERAVGSTVFLDMSGRLVLGDGDALLKDTMSGLLKQGRRQVVFNLADVSYADSSGLGAIVGTFLSARNEGGAVKLLNPSKRLQDLLSMAKLLQVLEVCDSEAQALSSFGADA
jgi:anti-anti-sigma factor